MKSASPAITPALLEALARQVRAGTLKLPPAAAKPTQAPQFAASSGPRAAFAVDSQPSAGSAGTTETVAQVALRELTGARASISDIIVQANRTTETETIAVGEALSAIVAEADRFVKEIRGSLSSLQGANPREQGLAELIDEQSRTVTAYVEVTRADAAAQREAAEAAHQQAQTIMKVGSTIAEVARSSKMLALNASIEAARLGSAGRSFAVIASQMQTLSDQVHESNQLVAQLATQLLELLPRIASSSSEMSKRSEAFNTALRPKMEKVQAGTGQLQRALTQSLGSSDDRLAKIISHSQDALSHLQFQDPTAQRLMRIDKTLESTERKMTEILQHQEYEAYIEQPLQEELGGGIDAACAPDAGDVMLF